MYQGSQPPWKTWEMSCKFSSQGKVREFKNSDSNQGKVREFYHVHLPKRESGCDISQSVAFFITKEMAYSQNITYLLFSVETLGESSCRKSSLPATDVDHGISKIHQSFFSH